MFCSISQPLLPNESIYLDIFAKYTSGPTSSSYPFKLYSQEEEDNTPAPIKKVKRRNSRGPYRKYTSQEKHQVILRILKGQSLKSIAEETKIPKRNLIRWKHEYLVQKKSTLAIDNSEDEEDSMSDNKSLRSGPITETKESLSQSNIKAEKNQH